MKHSNASKFTALLGGLALSLFIMISSLLMDLQHALSDFKSDIQHANWLFTQQIDQAYATLATLNKLYESDDSPNYTLLNLSKKTEIAYPFIIMLLKRDEHAENPLSSPIERLENNRLLISDKHQLVALEMNTEKLIHSFNLPLANLTGKILPKVQKTHYLHHLWQGKITNHHLFEVNGQYYIYALTRSLSWQDISFLTLLTLLVISNTLYAFFISHFNKKNIHTERMGYLVDHDALTHLPNRFYFEKLVATTISESRKNNSKAAVLFLDLDNFKRINDTFSHKIGDELLVQLSERLKKQVRTHNLEKRSTQKRKQDIITRLGGDEFIILLTNISDYQSASLTAKRILEDISQPFYLLNHKVFVSVSIGIALFPFDGYCTEQLLKNADTALYHAKERSKNNFQFYEKAMSLKIQRRLDIESKLRQAIQKNEFCLYYQPQIHTHTHNIVAAEALIRWNQSELGSVFPDEFIAIAEETHQIIHIGEWVINEVCSQIKKWRDAGYHVMRIAINLSGKQFSEAGLSTLIEEALQRNDLQPGCIELEITENTLMINTEETIATIDHFNEMGLSVSIDDFGTGHSSLSYLKTFPLESLKIDRSFVSDIPHNKDDIMIITAIVLMAKNLNMKVVAEGVENQAQMDFLQTLDCDLLQGYFVSKPMPVHEFEKLLAEGTKPRLSLPAPIVA